ncbi:MULTISPECIES: ABC transporter ATP-binding protein [Paenibacillus]|jgi:putative ABC transport system ATP-binding protein|uniref:ABC transporter ATP-binding protein n=1 Tax=Paenibacillus TaxID=44249 RepID=UPI0004092FAD|nr:MULTISPECIES: ABC transporter ATP-binding protein [Paenibacillus]MCF2716480.1 ABC transporter ATP-binding protein [Paenibacillus sp. UKAQ_18]UMY54733.1 ABC transporter ATP-binding protein [Paenibacillus peoriae]
MFILNEPVLSVKHLSKAYSSLQSKVIALNNVTFDLRQNEMLAVMGTSGSGKSTLLNILGAMDAPDEGEILLNGVIQKNIFTEPYATLYRSNKIGFIFQSFHLLKDLSVEENIALPLILKGKNDSYIKALVEEILTKIGLLQWRKHRPTQLSGGQQQRVAIGRAIIMSPPILLADEPTGNLDFNTSNDILNILVDMKKSMNQSMIIVTHDANIASYADRVLFFHDGQIIDTHKKEEEQQNLDQILYKFKNILEKTL